MRAAHRLAVATAVLGGGLLLAGPAAAQAVPDCDQYETLGLCPIGGEVEQPATGGGGGGGAGGAAGGGSSNATGGTSARAATLPFTGGEVTLIALAGTAAVGGGIALTAAGRKRKTV